MIMCQLEMNFIMTVTIKFGFQINLIALVNLVFHDPIKSPALLEPKFWRTHVELWVFEFSEFVQVLSDKSGILQILDQSLVDKVILAQRLDHEHSLLTYGTQGPRKIYVLNDGKNPLYQNLMIVYLPFKKIA